MGAFHIKKKFSCLNGSQSRLHIITWGALKTVMSNPSLEDRIPSFWETSEFSSLPSPDVSNGQPRVRTGLKLNQTEKNLWAPSDYNLGNTAHALAGQQQEMISGHSPFKPELTKLEQTS